MHKSSWSVAWRAHARKSTNAHSQSLMRQLSKGVRNSTLLSVTHFPKLSQKMFLSLHSSPGSVYSRLEARLPVSPITPNEALQLLGSTPSPTVHHLGVVEHLVRVIRGNACCLSPQLCLSLMSTLAFPTLPCGLCEPRCLDDFQTLPLENFQHSSAFRSSAPLENAAVGVALKPLYDTLMHCVMMDLRARVEGGQMNCEVTSTLLYSLPPPNYSSGENTGGRTVADDTSNSDVLERGAALLLAFSACNASSVATIPLGKSAHFPSDSAWQRRACVNTARAVLQRLADHYKCKREVGNAAESRLHDVPISDIAALCQASESQSDQIEIPISESAPFEEPFWASFCKSARRCWHWSILVCRATPIVPSRELRTFIVDSLIESFHVLHEILRAGRRNRWELVDSHRATFQSRPQQTRVACAEVLSWLLTRSLPIVNGTSTSNASLPLTLANGSVDGRDKAAAEKSTTASNAAGSSTSRHRQAWTMELRNVLLMLAHDFADVAVGLVSNYVSDPSLSKSNTTSVTEQSHLVELMASVAFHLSLQLAASGLHRTHTALSEVDVARRLLHSVLSLRLRIPHCSPMPLKAAEWSGIKVNESDSVLMGALNGNHSNVMPSIAVAEETWCRLTCVQHFVSSLSCALAPSLRNNLNDDNERSDRSSDGIYAEKAAVYRQLLCVGVKHLRQSTTVTRIGKSSYSSDTAAEGFAQATGTVLKPLHSLEFVFMLVKCWRAWLHARQRVLCNDRLADTDDCEELNTTVSAPQTSAEGVIAERKTPVTSVTKIIKGTDGAFQKSDNTAKQAELLSAHSLLSSAHELSLWIVEAWASALEVTCDRNPLDVCACWSALLTPNAEVTYDLHHRISPDVLEALKASSACEERLSRQCGRYLQDLKKLSLKWGAGTSSKACERRPRLWRMGQAPRETAGVDGCDEPTVKRWRPVFSPPFIAHVALRLLPSAVSSSFGRWNLNGAVDKETFQLPLSESELDVLRSTIDAPLSAELMFFQLSMIATFVEWCEAAAIDVGWSCLSAEDCLDDAAAKVANEEKAAELYHSQSAPWWVLTVEGFASTSGLQASSDTAALTFLWSLSDSVAGANKTYAPNCHSVGAGGDFSALLPEPPYSRSLCAVAPLFRSAWHSAQYRKREGSMRSSSVCSASIRVCLRQAVDLWTQRYALRLLLFFLHEEGWQRYGKVCCAGPWLVPSSPSKPQWSSGDLQAVSTLKHAEHMSTNHERGVHCTSVDAQSLSTTASNKCDELLCSETLQTLLCAAARRLLHRIDRLAVEVQKSRKLSHPSVSCSVNETRYEVTQLLCRLSGHARVTGTKRFHSSAGVTHLLASHRNEDVLLAPGISVTSKTDHVGLFSKGSALHSSCSHCVRVQELEDRLQSLGLITIDASGTWHDEFVQNDRVQTAKEENSCIDATMAEESHVLLKALCATPELTFFTSPRVLHFVDSLWRVCWKWLLQLSQKPHANHTARHQLGDVPEGICQCFSSETVNEAAELDALSTCRVLLHTVRQLHLLAAELMEYLCAVYVPALKVSTEGSFCFVTTPVEALQRQFAEHEPADVMQSSFLSSLLRHTVFSGSGPSTEQGTPSFSASSLRTYEVLCCGRFGANERRGPVVWQGWLRELAQKDTTLQRHYLEHWRSRIVDWR